MMGAPPRRAPRHCVALRNGTHPPAAEPAHYLVTIDAAATVTSTLVILGASLMDSGNIAELGPSVESGSALSRQD